MRATVSPSESAAQTESASTVRAAGGPVKAIGEAGLPERTSIPTRRSVASDRRQDWTTTR